MYFVGANYWQAPYISINDTYANLTTAIRNLTNHGIQSIRIMVSSQEPYYCYSVTPGMETDGNLSCISYRKIDFILNATREYNNKTNKLKVVMVLSNFWSWTGGLARYVNNTYDEITKIPCIRVNGSEAEFIEYTTNFYDNREAQDMLKRLFYNIANHVNEYSNVAYKNDDAIMSWEIVNEAIPGEDLTVFRSWVSDIVSYIKSIDTNHLVTIGSIGTRYDEEFMLTHEISGIDYITFSLHPSEWDWIKSSEGRTPLQNAKLNTSAYMKEIVEIARIIRKPLILNVFDYPRDKNSYSPSSKVEDRDDYFKHVLSEVTKYAEDRLMVGAYFWGWSDSFKCTETPKGTILPPPTCGQKWLFEHLIIGDRTDHPQGAFSVYESDTSTMKVIKKASDTLRQFPLQDPIPDYLWVLCAAIIGGFLLFLGILLDDMCRHLYDNGYK